MSAGELDAATLQPTLGLAGADVDRVVEHVDRARRRSEDGYTSRCD